MEFVFTNIVCLFGLITYPITIYQTEDKYVISVGCKNYTKLSLAVVEAKQHGCYCEQTHKILATLLGEKCE